LKILFGVSSVGLGHVRRSLEVANRLRRLGDYEIEWVSSEPTISFLLNKEECVLPICSKLKSLSAAMESRVSHGRLDDISRVARLSSALGRENYYSLKPTLANYDALVQDEFVETMFSFMWDKRPPLPKKRVVITDYFQFETGSHNPFSRIITWYANRMLVKAYNNSQLRIFADSVGFIPKKIPKFEIVGPILEQTPPESREELRRKLFPGKSGIVIVVSVGGTSAGKYLLDFFVSNQKSFREALDSTLVLLLGPRIDRSQYSQDSENLVFIPFTPEAPDYFKAADCVVAQAGGSTLNEIASIGTPCVTIPIKNHWEQETCAKKFSEKCGFKIVQSDELNIESLVTAIRSAINSKYEPMFSNGADQAAALISNHLKSGEEN
jgi:UDP-N-acetylglucosamine--N-acetylmuramyl-(pentapeptide) pyrophosphoryl-undecaprenol N-acetylglucosamine transferase